jgi:hypothetical protein
MFLRNLDGTLALMGHLLLPTASEAKREGGPTITPGDENYLSDKTHFSIFAKLQKSHMRVY